MPVLLAPGLGSPRALRTLGMRVRNAASEKGKLKCNAMTAAAACARSAGAA